MLRLIEKPCLRGYSTMAVDATADYVIEWDDEGDLHKLFTDSAYADVVNRRLVPLGGGSNVLFVSNPLHAGLLVCRRHTIELLSQGQSEVILRASAGVRLDDLVAYAVDHGLWGIENLSQIPGTVGAAALQNPGAYGQEFGDVVSEVMCYDRQKDCVVTFDRNGLAYGYRRSVLKNGGVKDRMIVVAVMVRLSKLAHPVLSYGRLGEAVAKDASSLTPADMRRAVSEIRSAKLPDPALMPSAGSFFMNPVVDADVYQRVVAQAEASGLMACDVPAYRQDSADGRLCYKLSAAWLIDRSGWKGYKAGNVALWPQQPLVIVNPGGRASGAEIATLASEISADVAAKWGVTLRPEVEYL